MSVLDKIYDFDVGTTIVSYRLAENAVLPKVGDEMSYDGIHAVIIDVNKESRKVKAATSRYESMQETAERHREALEENKTKIAETIFKHTTSGMTGLLGFESLSERDKDKYLKITEEIIHILNESSLLRV